MMLKVNKLRQNLSPAKAKMLIKYMRHGISVIYF